MPATYDCIATTTLGSTQSTVTFSSISGSFTDLVLIISGTQNTTTSVSLRFNGDTGTNYSSTFIYGTGSSAVSGRSTNQTNAQAIGRLGATEIGQVRAHIMNYSNTTTFKTLLGRGGVTSEVDITTVDLWRNTSAITSIVIAPEGFSGSFNSGCVFSLYGIKAA